MNTPYFLVAVIVLYFIPHNSLAQESTYRNDLELWNSLEFSVEPVKDFTLNISNSFRLKNNISQFKSNVTELSGDYKFNKYIGSGGGLRFTITDYQRLKRWFVDVSFRVKKKPFSFSYRARFHHEFSSNDFTENFWRSKFTVKYELSKKIDFFTANEWFYQFYYKGNRWQRTRIYAGIDFNLPKKFSIELYYMLEKQFNMAFPMNAHTIAWTLKYSL